MKKKLLATKLAFLALAAPCALSWTIPAPGGGATTVTTQQEVDVTGMVLDFPCAEITVSGVLHITTHATLLPSGGMLFHQTTNPQGATGTSTAGGTYHGGGATSITEALPGSASSITAAMPAVLIGEGRAPDVRVNLIVHTTVNANGTVTSDVLFGGFTCE